MAFSITSSHTVFTALPPAAVVISPSDPALVVVGTYLLDEQATDLKEKKTGSLELYQKTEDGTLKHLNSTKTKAVLDIKFSPHKPDLLAIAQSFGVIYLYQLQTRPESGPEIKLVQRLELFEHELLVLSVCFSPSDADELAYTLSDGAVGIISLSAANIKWQLPAHSLEAWTCTFSPDGKLLYSGGDDSVLCCHDTASQTTLWTDKKSHFAGVTAILVSDNYPGKIMTGSYDEHLRIFDAKTRREVEDVRLDGGVWRLHERTKVSILASCMHAGARVVDMRSRTPVVVAKFEEHESMNYGSWSHERAPGEIVSCSFYDKRLCLWSV